MKRASLIVLLIFIIDFIIDALIATWSNSSARYISKGLLMPLLLAFLMLETNKYIHKNKRAYKNLVVFALLFSFLGDIFLVKDSTLNFMLGIAAFLMAHIFYIIFFLRIQPFKAKNLFFILISGLLVLSYVILLDYLFWPHITQLQLTIPVVVYSFILGMMLFTAINVVNTTKRPRRFIGSLVTGSIFFVISDSILAFNKFYLQQPLHGVYIMGTYCLAQFLITEGAIQFIKKIKI